ncbi:hypothetical protein [Leptospira fluminis]|uniref:hypothetical protein n=1 Tax=Leptospira fluminis TaxID=2484979 RepID=UPI001AEFF936|nr:hypothetical protein [Leptospira fluminis]
MAKTSEKIPKRKKRSVSFAVMLLLPLFLFITTAFAGSFLKWNRVRTEAAFEERLNPLEKIWRSVQLKSLAREHGTDFREKISENQRRTLGILRESFLESLLPKFLFLAVVVLIPSYFFFQLIREGGMSRSKSTTQSRSKTKSVPPSVRSGSYKNPIKSQNRLLR